MQKLIKEIVTILELKIICIVDFINDTKSFKNDWSDEEKADFEKALHDKKWIESAIDSLKMTNLYSNKK